MHKRLIHKLHAGHKYMQQRLSQDRLAVILISGLTIIAALYELAGYCHYYWTVLDLGLFNRHMWGLAHGSLDANPLKGFNLIGDHAHFILMLITPVYWVFQSPIVLLIVQAISVGIGGVPVYLMAKRLGLAPVQAALWLIPYSMYFGFWAMLGYPFHEVAIAVPLISWTLLLLLSKRYAALSVVLLLLLLVKEDMPLLVVMVGLYIMCIQRKWRFGLGVLTVAVAYFWFLMQVWFPVVHHGYGYTQTAFGNGLGSLLHAAVAHPLRVIQALAMPQEKLLAVGIMVLSAGVILPFLGIDILVLLAPLWGSRFLSVEAWRWGAQEHYSATQGPILLFAALVGTQRLAGWLQGRMSAAMVWALALGCCMIGSVAGLIIAKPHYVAYATRGDFWVGNAHSRAASHAIHMIPDNASVGVQAAFPQVTGRKVVYALPVDLRTTHPQYLLLAPAFASYGRAWPFASSQAITDYSNEAKNRYGYATVYRQAGVELLQK